MALNNITFILGQGGLGRPLPGNDYISALLFYSGTLPSGFTTTNRVKQFFSVSDAESAGIKNDYNDATSATATVTFTTVGANGDTVNNKVTELNGVVVDLGTFKKTATETTVTLLATAVKAVINAGTITHGYTADNAAGVLTITAPKRLGIFLNSGSPLTTTVSGTLAATTVQFTGGVASKQAVWHYHISEFFRIQPQGTLYVGFFAVPSVYNYAEVTTMQIFANGSIRQIGVYKDGAALAANGADLIALDAICQANVSAHRELIGLLGADMSAVTDLATLYDLGQLTSNTASVVIAQDAAALGATLYLTTGKSITALGAMLGAVGLAKVSESIGWVAKFNMSNGTELDTIAFANGTLFSAVSDNLLTQLQNYRYIFLRKFVGVPGSYFNEESTAIAANSDYAYISNNRTIQKATRGVYTALIPALNSPLTLNSDGTLTDTTAAYIESLAEKNLQQMVRDGELSAEQVVVNPTQNVLSTNKLVVTINLVPIGTARNIEVNIGFNVTIS